MSVVNSLFERNAYVRGNTINLAFVGAALDIMKAMQHNYKREDVVAFYRFLADTIEDEKIAWAGKNPLKKSAKSAIIKVTEKEEKSIAPSFPDTTFKTMELRTRSAKPTKE